MISDMTFLQICDLLAENSKCLSRKVGAVIVKDGAVVGTGYNGPPRGIPHCDVRHRYDDELWKEIKNNCPVGTFDKRALEKLNMENVDWDYVRMNNEMGKCPRQMLGFGSGEGLEWCVAGHAERNVLINCAREGISTKGCVMYMNCGVPCSPCLVEIINAGISEIVVTNFGFYDKSAEYLVRNSHLKVRNYDGESFDKQEKRE